MTTNELVSRRFSELEVDMEHLPITRSTSSGRNFVPSGIWQEWSTSALNLLEGVFGFESVHARNFREAYTQCSGYEDQIAVMKGIFRAAVADFKGGYIFGLEQMLFGEILGDFVALAKASLQEGNKDVAAVLACAALEDALKRFARRNGLIVDDKVMQEVVAALKSKGAVSGAQKTLLDTMPKIRDYAMHANWDKITNADVGGVIGFVEQFLLSHFS